MSGYKTARLTRYLTDEAFLVVAFSETNRKEEKGRKSGQLQTSLMSDATAHESLFPGKRASKGSLESGAF